MALENPALSERSFQRGIEETGAEPHGMSASGTYAIAGLLFVIVVAAAALSRSSAVISPNLQQLFKTPFMAVAGA